MTAQNKKRKLPKLRPCQYCGKEPEFYNGWYDTTRAIAGLTVFCKCNKLYITPYPYSLNEAIRNDSLIQTVIDDVARRWEEFCHECGAKMEVDE